MALPKGPALVLKIHGAMPLSLHITKALRNHLQTNHGSLVHLIFHRLRSTSELTPVGHVLFEDPEAARRLLRVSEFRLSVPVIKDLGDGRIKGVAARDIYAEVEAEIEDPAEVEAEDAGSKRGEVVVEELYRVTIAEDVGWINREEIRLGPEDRFLANLERRREKDKWESSTKLGERLGRLMLASTGGFTGFGVGEGRKTTVAATGSGTAGVGVGMGARFGGMGGQRRGYATNARIRMAEDQAKWKKQKEEEEAWAKAHNAQVKGNATSSASATSATSSSTTKSRKKYAPPNTPSSKKEMEETFLFNQNIDTQEGRMAIMKKCYSPQHPILRNLMPGERKPRSELLRPFPRNKNDVWRLNIL